MTSFIGALRDTLLFFLFPFTLPLLLLACYKQPTYVGGPLLAYFAHCAFWNHERRNGAPWESFSKHFFLLKTMRESLKLRLHVPSSLKKGGAAVKEPDAAFVFAIHPHGVGSDFRAVADGMFYDELGIKSWRTLAASILFRLPLIREICLWTHCVDASRSVAERVMKKGHSIMVLPGGEREQLMTEHGKEVVYLKKRFGFVKLAKKFGRPLVPVYVFGSNDLYKTSRFMYGLRLWMVETLGICIPIFWGKYGLLSPFDVPQEIVFGEPMEVGEAVADPPKEVVAELHAKYIASLTKLFDDNKAKFGVGDRKLVVA